MKTLCSFLLLSILALWVELPLASLEGKPGKPGLCPFDRCKCIGPQLDQCMDDFSCEGEDKCCHSCCAKRCVKPEKVRPGKCPIDLIKCLKKEQNVCKYDSQCLKPKKCCYNFCAYRCVNPA